MHAEAHIPPGGGERIVVGISGGVDSSVAALLLKEAGYDVHGLFMTNWEEDEQGYCTSAEDYQDARAACEHLGIPLHRANFAAEYRRRVFQHFLDEYRAGRTPNPDVLCNREIKFGEFLLYARRLGARRIATGHYARLRASPTGIALLTGVDEAKDQSYFLHAVNADALALTVFPLGHLRKREVRALARAHGLPNFDRRDSTGICFIGERPFREFLSGYLPTRPGDIVTPAGERLGGHQGLMLYTLGQRQGLGIGGRAGSGEDAWYVIGKDLEHNTLIVDQGHEHPALYAHTAIARQLHWIGPAPHAPLRCQARVRYRQASQACRAQIEGDALRVRFDSPQRAVTPGQYLVLYDGERCLGGGVIERTDAPAPQACATAAARSDPAFSH